MMLADLLVGRDDGPSDGNAGAIVETERKDTGSFEDERVLYGYGPELLLIGKFCAIAAGVRFVMDGANHLSSGPSAFPFTIFPGRDRSHPWLSAIWILVAV